MRLFPILFSTIGKFRQFFPMNTDRQIRKLFNVLFVRTFAIIFLDFGDRASLCALSHGICRFALVHSGHTIHMVVVFLVYQL
jgi:hypothetical protein